MGRLGIVLLLILAFLAALSGFAWLDAKKQAAAEKEKVARLEAELQKGKQPLMLQPSLEPSA